MTRDFKISDLVVPDEPGDDPPADPEQKLDLARHQLRINVRIKSDTEDQRVEQ